MSCAEKFCEQDTIRGHVLGRDESLLHHGKMRLMSGSARCVLCRVDLPTGRIQGVMNAPMAMFVAFCGADLAGA